MHRDVVLVPGWGAQGAVWQPLLDGLASEWRCRTIDLPGHGRQPWRGERGIAAWADAVLAHAPPRAVWIGWSLGALVALHTAVHHPERVARLVMMAGTPRFIAAPDWACGVAPEVLEAFRRLLARDPEAVLRRFAALQVQGETDAAALRRRLLALGAVPGRPSAEALDAGLEVLATADLRTDLDALAAPTLWLAGDRDRVIPVAASRAAAARVPRAELAVLEGAAHVPMLSRPQACVNRVRTFLNDG